MAENEKLTLTNAGKISYFSDAIQKLTCENILSEEEKEFLLQAAILLAKKYELDSTKKSYFELAYYIVLKYSISYHDYEPLYDFSFNYGFYPTVEYINKNGYIDEKSIDDIAKELIIEKHKENNLTYTLHQQFSRNEIIKEKNNDICYIAPTSFGKSSIIFDLIKINLKHKHAIIVPTKSLLAQTVKKLKSQNLDIKIISHDEMYLSEDSFVAVFTQERALRLLEKVEWGFDYLYIDEAHNIFNRDSRNILLTRLISLNKKRNNKGKLIYLSPLIDNPDNLIIENDNSKISPFKIDNNIKIPEFYYYNENDKLVQKYNKFFNKYYPINLSNDLFHYIQVSATEKNLIYFYRPKIVERFANELYKKIPAIKLSKETKGMIKVLKKYVHKDFNVVNLLTKGIVYLHGKLPEYIKDYLEYKFNRLADIKYLIGNSVILEGVNLPLSSLYILDPYSLTFNKTINLIGRINRLNEIFGDNGKIERLLPQIHFIKSNYCSARINMKNYLEKLRDTRVIDEIDNPLLNNYFIVEKDNEQIQKIKAKDDKIKEIEQEYFKQPKNKKEQLKHDLISYGMHEFFDIDDKFINVLQKKLNYYKKNLKTNALTRIFNTFFYKENENIIDYEIKRLKEKPARNYYKNFIEKAKQRSLKNNVVLTLKNFKRQIDRRQNLLYVGGSYGEVDRNGIPSLNFKENVYVDISKMDNIERTNIAIIKLKMEEDFISFKINKFIEMALDYRIITEDEYNTLIYGTINDEDLKLIKQGFPINLLNKMLNDEQIKNISFNECNMPVGNENLKKYYEKQDDFYKFQIEKYIIFK